MTAAEAHRILRVGIGSDNYDIKAAWRREAKKHHPDRGGSPAAFARAAEAYDVLSSATPSREADPDCTICKGAGGGTIDFAGMEIAWSCPRCSPKGDPLRVNGAPVRKKHFLALLALAGIGALVGGALADALKGEEDDG